MEQVLWRSDPHYSMCYLLLDWLPPWSLTPIPSLRSANCFSQHTIRISCCGATCRNGVDTISILMRIGSLVAFSMRTCFLTSQVCFFLICNVLLCEALFTLSVWWPEAANMLQTRNTAREKCFKSKTEEVHQATRGRLYCSHLAPL